MSDITMCLNNECPLRQKCLRWLRESDMFGWQSYADFKPGPDGKCDGFLTRADLRDPRPKRR